MRPIHHQCYGLTKARTLDGVREDDVDIIDININASKCWTIKFTGKRYAANYRYFPGKNQVLRRVKRKALSEQIGVRDGDE